MSWVSNSYYLVSGTYTMISTRARILLPYVVQHHIISRSCIFFLSFGLLSTRRPTPQGSQLRRSTEWSRRKDHVPPKERHLLLLWYSTSCLGFFPPHVDYIPVLEGELREEEVLAIRRTISELSPVGCPHHLAPCFCKGARPP